MENILNGFALLGIPVLVLLPLLIMGLKALGMPTSWTGFVAIGVGIIIMFLIEAIKTWPSIERWVAVPVFGIILGLSANGINSQWKHFVKTREEDAREEEIKTLAKHGPVLPIAPAAPRYEDTDTTNSGDVQPTWQYIDGERGPSGGM